MWKSCLFYVQKVTKCEETNVHFSFFAHEMNLFFLHLKTLFYFFCQCAGIFFVYEICDKYINKHWSHSARSLYDCRSKLIWKTNISSPKITTALELQYILKDNLIFARSTINRVLDFHLFVCYNQRGRLTDFSAVFWSFLLWACRWQQRATNRHKVCYCVHVRMRSSWCTTPAWTSPPWQSEQWAAPTVSKPRALYKTLCLQPVSWHRDRNTRVNV